ncbi:MAG TPA: DUF1822 family protein [Allocoleopsis sp.]
MAINTNLSDTIFISEADHITAKKFASEQSTPAKFKQVYLNTLAVQAVQRYINWFELHTNLEQSESWNPVIRSFNNVADLLISNIGRIECIPILPEQKIIHISSEVSEDRIAYIAVQFQQELNKVCLLGFLPTLTKEDLDKPPQIDELPGIKEEDLLSPITLEQLQPIFKFNDYLTKVENRNNQPTGVKLSNWFTDIIDDTWQMIEQVFSPQKLAQLGSRDSENNAAIRARKINFPSANLSVNLTVSATELALVNRKVQLAIYPENSETLPEGGKIVIFDTDWEMIKNCETSIGDPLLTLSHSDKIGARFIVQIVFGQDQYIEEFVI